MSTSENQDPTGEFAGAPKPDIREPGREPPRSDAVPSGQRESSTPLTKVVSTKADVPAPETGEQLTPRDAVKVVILGQDPYHGPGQAHGLAFSVQKGVRVPPSLVNIYKELEADLGIPRAAHGNLENWARQGVLLLNNALTVEAGQAGSHQKRGWEDFTDAVVAEVAHGAAPTVFVLWGSHAQKKAARIAALSDPSHLVLRSPHPSPLSAHAGFFGSHPFSQANAFLEANGRSPIDWRV